MKIFLLLIIKLYWKIIPESKRRKCLFKISCSRHVYYKTKKEGLISGVKALSFRMKNCNPNYYIIEVNGKKALVSNTNKVFKTEELNKSFIN